MADFEVHEIGTAREIRLSRQLSNAIQQLIEQYGPGIIPQAIKGPYDKLYDYYQQQIHEQTL